MEAITIEIKGIKCDNPKCDYTNPDVEREDYKEFLNAQCPKCGDNLLTDADMDAVIAMEKMAVVMNEAFAWVDEDELNTKTVEKTVEIDVKMDGSGTMEFGEPIENDSNV